MKSILLASPSKQKDSVPSNLTNHSPARRKKRKPRPTIRGCILDTTDDSLVDSGPSTVSHTIITAPTQETKRPKKAKKKQLF